MRTRTTVLNRATLLVLATLLRQVRIWMLLRSWRRENWQRTTVAQSFRLDLKRLPGR